MREHDYDKGLRRMKSFVVGLGVASVLSGFTGPKVSYFLDKAYMFTLCGGGLVVATVPDECRSFVIFLLDERRNRLKEENVPRKTEVGTDRRR